MFHVTSVRNRTSIRTYGLDVACMGVARGIAGSTRPEAQGVFLSSAQWDVDWFVRMNKTGGPVDVWRVDGVDSDQLVGNGNGYFYLPGRIPADRLTLDRQDVDGGEL